MIFNPNYEYTLIEDEDEDSVNTYISIQELKKFNPILLGIGNINVVSESKEVIASIFDLEGFTDFCKQVDPHLSVPSFLNDFLKWLYLEIEKEITAESIENGKAALWSELPFFSKFLGDGILLLWNINTKEISNQLKDDGTKIYSEVQSKACNIVISLDNICKSYNKFVKDKLAKRYVNPPSRLRCGVARGFVLSIGNGQDYVGPSINIASRLQKLHGLRFCFQKRGFDIETGMNDLNYEKYILKKVEIRGIGENELVYVRKKEFEKLGDTDKKHFRIP